MAFLLKYTIYISLLHFARFACTRELYDVEKFECCSCEIYQFSRKVADMALCSAQAKPTFHFRKDCCNTRKMAYLTGSLTIKGNCIIGRSMICHPLAVKQIFPQASRRVMCRSGPEQKPSSQQIERQLLIDLIVQYVLNITNEECVFAEALFLVVLSLCQQDSSIRHAQLMFSILPFLQISSYEGHYCRPVGIFGQHRAFG